MKNKNFVLVSLSILALVFCLAFAGAQPVFTDIPPNATINSGSNWAGVDFDAVDNVDVGDTITFSVNDVTHFTITQDGFLNDKLTLPVGVYNVNVSISNSSGDTNWTLYKLEVVASEEAETCEFSDNGNLDISIEDLSVEKNNGKSYGKDNEWLPLDDVNVEISVSNEGNEKIKNIEIKWGLYNKDSGEWIIDDKENDFNLNDGDDKTVTISFELDQPKDFEDSGDYVFYAWATGEDEEFDGDETCIMDSESVDIIIESDFVVMDNIEIPETALCGSDVQISADVWNIGEDDQDDVSVLIYNKDLGLNKVVEIGDIDAFDNEPIDFTFQLPKDAEEKSYPIKFTVYDEDNSIYQNEYDDEDSASTVFLKVEGGCSVAEASVSAVLESGGQAGKPMIVKATIVNTGDKTTSYSLNAAGYAEWASSASLDKTSLNLDAGKSEQVLLTFNVNKEALGDKLFYLEVLSENELIVNQPVQVEITKKSGLGITGNVFSGESKYLWGIGIINLILVILIIVIAVRIARK